MDIEFLTERDVLQIHQDQITRYGGSLGILNQGQLESALAMPRQQAFGQYLLKEYPTWQPPTHFIQSRGMLSAMVINGLEWSRRRSFWPLMACGLSVHLI
jgi:hypothetical protein